MFKKFSSEGYVVHSSAIGIMGFVFILDFCFGKIFRNLILGQKLIYSFMYLFTNVQICTSFFFPRTIIYAPLVRNPVIVKVQFVV